MRLAHLSSGILAGAALSLAGLILLALAAVPAHGGAGAIEDHRDDYEMHLELAVPTDDGGWEHVTIVMLLDPFAADFDAQAQAAREGMLARFPGAIDLSAGDGPTAQYALLGFTWPGNQAGWRYNSAGSPASAAGAASAIAAGAGSWAQQGADWQFTGGGASSAPSSLCANGRRDGDNVVGWDSLAGNTLAVTCWYRNQQGDAVEFDMHFDNDRTWGGSLDLYTVALHEFGHALGLGHSDVGCGSASQPVMCPYYAGPVAGPRADDVAGLIALYGGDAQEPPATATKKPTKTATPTPAKTRRPAATPVPPTPSAAERTVTLTEGANLIVWPGVDSRPETGLSAVLGDVEAVYSYDARTRTWQLFVPGGLVIQNSLAELREGEIYWVFAYAPVTFTARP